MTGGSCTAAVILPVEAVFLRELQTAQVAVVLFEIRGQVLYTELFFQLLADLVDPPGVLMARFLVPLYA